VKEVRKVSKERLIGLVAGVLVIGAVYYLVVIRPALLEIALIQKSREAIIEKIELLEQDERLYQSYDRTRREHLEHLSSRLLQRIPRAADIEGLCLELSRLAAEHGIEGVHFEYVQQNRAPRHHRGRRARAVEATASPVQEISLTVKLRSEYPRVLRFVNGLPEIKRLVVIEELKIVPMKALVQAELTLRTFVRREAETGTAGGPLS
jgi:Tfp pilus assembly protein PilO